MLIISTPGKTGLFRGLLQPGSRELHQEERDRADEHGHGGAEGGTGDHGGKGKSFSGRMGPVTVIPRVVKQPRPAGQPATVHFL